MNQADDAELALAELVRLKDGPRDEAYERDKPAAWDRARAVLARRAEPATPPADALPWDDLRESGLLWLINRVVFHPRGWALALVQHDFTIVGWHLLGDGTEVWRYDGGEDDLFARAQVTLAPPDSPPEAG